MRGAALALAAGLVAQAALAQEAPRADEESPTVTQPRHESGSGVGAGGAGATATTPPDGTRGGTSRFVRVPDAEGFEVTPLAPPEGAAEAQLPDPSAVDGGADGTAPDQRTGEGPPPGQASIGILPGQPAPADPQDPRFRSAPEDGAASLRPDGVAVPIAPPETEQRPGVRLRELDKMTGQIETFQIAVGDSRQVDRLKIQLESCRSPATNDTHGTIAFLKVWDTREPETPAFSGWMFAQSPSLSALDHPRYDLWVISCTTSAIATSAPSE